MKVKYYGVRGSVPTPGRATIRYGGNTPCVSVRCGDQLLILDCGTGLRVLGEELMQTEFGRGEGRAAFFVSHTHWDHIHGFPFFTPAYVQGNAFHLHGIHQINKGLETAMHHQQQYQNFPVLLSQMPSTIHFSSMEEGDELVIGDGVLVTNCELNHPGGACAYRVDYRGKSIVYATDTEHYQTIDLRLQALSRDADILIYDSMFTPEEYQSHQRWGHSTYEEGIRLAREAGVRSLHLFHHAPHHDDDFMDDVLARARDIFPEVHIAQEGLEVEL